MRAPPPRLPPPLPRAARRGSSGARRLPGERRFCFSCLFCRWRRSPKVVAWPGRDGAAGALGGAVPLRCRQRRGARGYRGYRPTPATGAVPATSAAEATFAMSLVLRHRLRALPGLPAAPLLPGNSVLPGLPVPAGLPVLTPLPRLPVATEQGRRVKGGGMRSPEDASLSSWI